MREITKEEAAKIDGFIEKWKTNGLTAGAPNKERVIELVNLVYKAAKAEPPSHIEFVDSPPAAMKYIAKRTKTKVQFVEPDFFGNHESGWLAYYDYFNTIGVDQNLDDVLPLVELAQQVNWCWFYEDTAIICSRPEITIDEQNRLHNPSGPAVRYADGTEMFFWRGFCVERDVIMAPETIDPARCFNDPNAELRRVLVEILGWKRVLTQLKVKEIDVDPDPEIGALLEAKMPDGKKERFLKVQCGTKREFVLPVPPNMKTALEANAWTYFFEGLDITKFKPEVRT